MTKKTPKQQPANKPPSSRAEGPQKSGTAMDAGGKPLWRRGATYIIGLVVILIAAMVTAIGTGIGDTIGRRTGKIFSERFDPAKPFGVTVDQATSTLPYAVPMVIKDPGDTTPLLDGSVDDGQALLVFVRQRNGAPTQQLVMNVVLTGTSANSIRIINMKVIRTALDQVLTGTKIQPPSGGGGEDTIPLVVNMDQPRHDILGRDSHRYFTRRNIDLAKDERVTLNMEFKATKYSYRWLLRFDYVGPDNAKRSVFVDADGNTSAKPDGIPAKRQFALTGMARRYRREFETNFPATGYHLVQQR
jgi:hypothetical protein